ncbi:uncharacterized protein PHACADRAFT_190016 [Phanerochaete carnosa HHB-10118-sp]|uniref:Uncharacterized protein n=1 Tax=Phanerochaete carnosa (strain HHB-10118-sp) TaxID=650164 RepID=K5WNW6_PHACS|nr:uncharacterized protein PHACADRAFT_190016 [Phanerochaete carnosa HHB-10118-sp]EKM60889.1 hypothetical protein PHACADRAFT_190016 [Phanerochaete carnosa HHB-10118-sp]
MLKRQRLPSPLPLQWDAVEDEKNLPEDLLEPMSKRRRYFATGSYAEEQSDAECQGDTPRTEYGSEAIRREVHAGAREWRKDAGEYKHANSLLHDLHAEQRHRLIFSATPSSPSASPHLCEEIKPRNVPRSPHPASPPIDFGTAYDPPRPSDDPVCKREGEGILAKEAEVVSQRYAESHKAVTVPVPQPQTTRYQRFARKFVDSSLIKFCFRTPVPSSAR